MVLMSDEVFSFKVTHICRTCITDTSALVFRNPYYKLKDLKAAVTRSTCPDCYGPMSVLSVTCKMSEKSKRRGDGNW